MSAKLGAMTGRVGWRLVRRSAIAGLLAAVASLSPGAVWQAAAADVAEQAPLELIGRIGGPLGRAAVVPPYAYVPMGTGVAVLDVADPAAPRMVGRHDFWTYGVRDVAAINSYVFALSCGLHGYMNDHYCGVRILDFRDPTEPGQIGSLGVGRDPAVALSLDAAEGRLYASSSDTLVVFDVSRPSASESLGAFVTPSIGFAMAAGGGHAYFLKERSGRDGQRTPDQLIVLNATDPSAIEKVATVLVADETRGIALSGSRLLISDDNGLHTYDVSTPSEPRHVGFADLPGDPQEMAVAGDLVYVAAGDAGVRVVDIGDAEHPTELKGHISPLLDAHYVSVSGDRAYVVDPEVGLHIAEIHENGYAGYLGNFDGIANVRRIAVAGDFVLAVSDSAGLLIVDVSRPELPVVVARHDWKTLESVLTVDHIAVLASGDDGLSVMELTELPELMPLGTSFAAKASDLAAVGDMVYATHGPDLRVVDISDPSAPTIIGQTTLPADGGRLDARGSHVFAVSGNALASVTVANPAQPLVTGVLVMDRDPRDVAVVGDAAYVASGYSGLRVVDVSDPSDMTPLGVVSMPELGLREWYAPSVIAVVDDRLFIGDSGQPSPRTGGLHVTYDENGVYTRYAGSLPRTPARVVDVAVSDDQAFVADELGGLLIAQVAPAPSTVGLLLPAVLNQADPAPASR